MNIFDRILQDGNTVEELTTLYPFFLKHIYEASNRTKRRNKHIRLIQCLYNTIAKAERHVLLKQQDLRDFRENTVLHPIVKRRKRSYREIRYTPQWFLQYRSTNKKQKKIYVNPYERQLITVALLILIPMTILTVIIVLGLFDIYLPLPIDIFRCTRYYCKGTILH